MLQLKSLFSTKPLSRFKFFCFLRECKISAMMTGPVPNRQRLQNFKCAPRTVRTAARYHHHRTHASRTFKSKKYKSFVRKRKEMREGIEMRRKRRSVGPRSKKAKLHAPEGAPRNPVTRSFPLNLRGFFANAVPNVPLECELNSCTATKGGESNSSTCECNRRRLHLG